MPAWSLLQAPSAQQLTRLDNSLYYMCASRPACMAHAHVPVFTLSASRGTVLVIGSL